MLLGVEETVSQSLRERLIAGGTVGAVVVALFWAPIREHWSRPKLAVSFDATSPDAMTVDVDYLDGHGAPTGATAPSHWLRLLVGNARGRQSAHEVSVFATSVERLDGSSSVRVPLDTIALVWSNLKEPVERVEVPPGVERRVDVARLAWPEGTVAMPPNGSGGCRAELQVIPEPSARRNLLVPGRYRLELALTARDLDAQRFAVELVVDGIWEADPDNVKPHFMLEGLRRVR